MKSNREAAFLQGVWYWLGSIQSLVANMSINIILHQLAPFALKDKTEAFLAKLLKSFPLYTQKKVSYYQKLTLGCTVMHLHYPTTQ